ncbi:MAG: ATP-binding protein, partial [Pedobacter sp.]
MSLLIGGESENQNNILAYIKQSKVNKKVGVLAFDEKDNIGVSAVELTKDHSFQLVPFKHKERSTLFVAGESGAGKSYFVREYAKEYRKMYPNNPIYLISYLEHDETLDSYKEIIRLDAFSQDFLDECLDIKLDEEFPDCFVIFDDIDSIVEKKIKVKIYGLLNKMLRIGRHYGISVAYVGHELYNSPELNQILNESMTITFFPKYLNY